MDQPFLIKAVVYVVIIALFLRRTLTTQTMRVTALPILAVVFVVLGGVGIAYTPPSPYAAVAIAIGIVLGVALGYLRGRHSQVTPGPRPGTIRVKASPVLSAVIILALLVRVGMRYVFKNDPLTADAISDGAIAFAVLSVAVARLMLFGAARRVIAPAI